MKPTEMIPEDKEINATGSWKLFPKENRAELSDYWCENEKQGGEYLSLSIGKLKEKGIRKLSVEATDLTRIQQSCLAKAGFSLEKKESRDLLVTLKELSALPLLKATGNTDGNSSGEVKSIQSLLTREFRKTVAYCAACGRMGVLPDLCELPMEWYDAEVSACVSGDRRARGLLLVHAPLSGRLMVDLLAAFGTDFQKQLLNMMRFSVEAASVKYPENTIVILRRHSAETESLAGKLFPGKQGEQVWYGECEIIKE